MASAHKIVLEMHIEEKKTVLAGGFSVDINISLQASGSGNNLS